MTTPTIVEKAEAVKKCPICEGTGIFREILDGNPNHTLAYTCKACFGEKYIDINVGMKR